MSGEGPLGQAIHAATAQARTAARTINMPKRDSSAPSLIGRCSPDLCLCSVVSIAIRLSSRSRFASLATCRAYCAGNAFGVGSGSANGLEVVCPSVFRGSGGMAAESFVNGAGTESHRDVRLVAPQASCRAPAESSASNSSHHLAVDRLGVWPAESQRQALPTARPSIAARTLVEGLFVSE